MKTKDLFGDIDLTTLENDSSFKEDSVREEIIIPILHALGYQSSNIERSKSLIHPFLRTGSKQRPITYIPDYALKIDGSYPWVLDAKSPEESVTDPGNLEQVYSYSSHPEIRSIFFALCNGIEFILFRRESTNVPILHFPITDIEKYWNELVRFIGRNSFHTGKPISYEQVNQNFGGNFDYLTRPLPEEVLKLKRQSAKRHKGVHGYFTRQSWNVVATYILNFSKPGDLVLDPFGGSGVTAIEAMMNNRKAISIDLNPLAVFIVNSLIA
jgi:hypothetical protein